MSPELQEFSRKLVGQTPRMQGLHRQIERVGRTRWPALILGETGTGKEVVARQIHNVTRTGPFVTIDCSSLVAPLMESELFGYSKGAFTGAASSKLGLIELANGGTAFFDEIGELPLEMQSKLLRVLQEKEFRPVGALSSRKSEFRIIAATNRNIAAEVERGTFRRDLFYRLNVVTLRLEPLRERKNDIPALVDHFLEKYGSRHSLTQETKDALMFYEWPGNVRELENCVQHMVAMNSGPLVHVPDLPSMLQNNIFAARAQSVMAAAGAGGSRGVASVFPGVSSSPGAAVSPVYCNVDSPPGCPVAPLVEIERRAILDALQYTKGDRATAAALLGIGRTTLYRKLKVYGIE